MTTKEINPQLSVKPFFENLDTLRFLSFLTVFLFHVRLYDYVAGFTDNWIILAVCRVICSGGWGVTFFFVLSGFLITWLLLTEIRKKGRIHVGAFYMRRVLRIWPLYMLVMLVGIIIMPQIYKLAHQQLFFDYKVPLYVAFLSNYGVLALNPAFDAIRSYSLIMNITWSVSIEEQFYVIWPLFFLLPDKLRRLVPVLFIVVSIIAAIIYAHDARQLYSSSFTRIGEIATGALFAVAAFTNERFLKSIQQLPRVLIILIYLFSFLVIYISFRFEWQWPAAEYGLHMLGAVLFSFIILEQNFSQKSLFKYGRLKIFGSLGKVSYGLYMLHPVAMFAASVALQMLLHRNAPVVKGPAYMALAFCLAVAFSYLSYYVFEKPFLRLKDRFGFERQTTSLSP